MGSVIVETEQDTGPHAHQNPVVIIFFIATGLHIVNVGNLTVARAARAFASAVRPPLIIDNRPDAMLIVIPKQYGAFRGAA